MYNTYGAGCSLCFGKGKTSGGSWLVGFGAQADGFYYQGDKGEKGLWTRTTPDMYY
jgi:hypothetical protein